MQEIRRYHSRKSHRDLANDDALWNVIAQAKYATLALSTPDGDPYCVALSLGFDREAGCLYFHTGFSGKKIEVIRANPRACAYVLQDEGYVHGYCHHEYHSVICYGRIVEISDEEEKRAALVKLYHCLEGNPESAEAAMRPRDVRSMPMRGVNLLRMDISGISGKKSSHKRYEG